MTSGFSLIYLGFPYETLLIFLPGMQYRRWHTAQSGVRTHCPDWSSGSGPGTRHELSQPKLQWHIQTGLQLDPQPLKENEQKHWCTISFTCSNIHVVVASSEWNSHKMYYVKFERCVEKFATVHLFVEEAWNSSSLAYSDTAPSGIYFVYI